MSIPQLPSKYEQFKEQAFNIVDSFWLLVPLTRKTYGVLDTMPEPIKVNPDGGRRLTAW